MSQAIPYRFPSIPQASTVNRTAPQNGVPVGATEWAALERAVVCAVGQRVPPRPCCLHGWQITSTAVSWTATLRLPPRASHARVWIRAVSGGPSVGDCTLSATSSYGTVSVSWTQGTGGVTPDIFIQVADPSTEQTQPAEVTVELEVVCDVDDAAALRAWGVDLMPLSLEPGAIP